MSTPATDRAGQHVQICHEPRIVYEVTEWNADIQRWEAKCIEPSPLMQPLYFREDFLETLDVKGDVSG